MALVALVARERPDAVVVDIRAPPTYTDEGLVAAARMRDAHPEVGVVVLSAYLEASWALRVRERAKGVGYLLKDRVVDRAILVDALRRFVSTLMGRMRRHDPLADLTEREREVLALSAEGLLNRAIAARPRRRRADGRVAHDPGLRKLGLEETPDQHRHVLAVLTLLRA